MATTPRRQSFSRPLSQIGLRMARRFAGFVFVACAAVMDVQFSCAQATAEFHRNLTVSPAQPAMLDVDLSSGDLQIVYGRDGQVSITAIARASADARLEDNFFSGVLAVAQEGNRLTFRDAPHAAFAEAGVNVAYRIDVPYRTEVISTLGRGDQSISGILGPVRAVAHSGDIKVSYVSQGTQAQVDQGNLEIQVIGEHVEAKVGAGNISCTRIRQGVSAETEDGDITLMVVGPSSAKVKNGRGRIDVGGARGSLIASTAEGDLRVKAIPHDEWQITSVSGNIRLEFPPAAKLELAASTSAGEFQIDRDDMTKPAPGLHRFEQKVNGGGKRIEAHTGSGKIVIR